MGHIPVRTCVSCRRADAQHALVRLAVVDDHVVVDDTRHGPGRGAYLCPTDDCVDRALRRDGAALRRALRTDRTPGRIDVEGLAAQLPRGGGSRTTAWTATAGRGSTPGSARGTTARQEARRPPGAAKSVTARPSGVVE